MTKTSCTSQTSSYVHIYLIWRLAPVIFGSYVTACDGTVTSCLQRRFLAVDLHITEIFTAKLL